MHISKLTYNGGLTLSIGGPKSFEFARIDVSMSVTLEEGENVEDAWSLVVSEVETRLEAKAAEATGIDLATAQPTPKSVPPKTSKKKVTKKKVLRKP